MSRRLALVAGLLAACAEPAPLPRPLSPPPVPAASAALLAGAVRKDITPPLGLGMWGYGLDGQVAHGWRSRLYARALVLEDARGERVALVAVDLGAVPLALQRMVAERVVGHTGIGADRLLIGATHTHGGPSHYFDRSTYNLHAAVLQGFSSDWQLRLVELLAGAVSEAFDRRAPAQLGWDVAPAPAAAAATSRNRSIGAFRTNAAGPPGAPDPVTSAEETATDKRLAVLRVDALTGEPIAGLAVFGVHGTAVSHAHDLWSGDLFAALERTAEAALGGVPVLALNGAAGDVSPVWKRQDYPEAFGLGAAIGSAVVAAHARIVTHAGATLARRHEDVVFPGARLADGTRLCATPEVGIPTVGGAEDGRTVFYGIYSWEGRRDLERWGCHSPRASAAGFLQPFLLTAHDVPDVAPVQLVRVGDVVLAAVPGEVTTMQGYRTTDAIGEALRARGTPAAHVVLVSLANAYVQYVTTPEEYIAQHYEGASTLYGPNEGRLVEERLVALAADLDRALPVELHEAFMWPGPALPKRAPAASAPVTLGDARGCRRGTLVELALEWTGPDGGGLDLAARPWLVGIRGESGALLDDDRSLAFEVREWAPGQWRARWFPAFVPAERVRACVAEDCSGFVDFSAPCEP